MQCKWVVDVVPKITLPTVAVDSSSHLSELAATGVLWIDFREMIYPQKEKRLMGKSGERNFTTVAALSVRKNGFTHSEFDFQIFCSLKLCLFWKKDACQSVEEISQEYNNFHFFKIYCKVHLRKFQHASLFTKLSNEMETNFWNVSSTGSL